MLGHETVPHFIHFVRIRILSILSVRRLSGRESVRPYPRFIPTLSVPFTVNVDEICISTGIKVVSYADLL